MPQHTTSQDTPLKRCPKCGESKPATTEYFARSKRDSFGWQPKCKACDRAYHAANKERIAERRRAYSAANKERKAERDRAYRNANKERIAERDHAYYIANRERIDKRSRAYDAAHKERVTELGRARENRRRVRKANAVGSHTAADVAAQYKAQKGRCYYCGVKVGDAYHADHVIPLSRGGSDGPENIVIACPTCNLRKNDRLPVEWAEGGRLL